MKTDNPAAGTLSSAEVFLMRLRSVTSESHKNLESLPVSASILSPTVSSRAYAHYLKLMYDVIFETENSIFPLVESIFPDLDDRRKLMAIRHDLHFLNSEPVKTRTVFATGDREFTTPFALGIFYVVEGSSLGGRLILKNITPALGYDENLGARYFSGYGNSTGTKWKTFLNILTDYEMTHAAGEEIIAGAEFAFRAIHKHFS